MPNCFSLTPKFNPASGASAFSEIDDLMCRYFHVVPHPEKFYQDWYNYVALSLACGKKFEEIRKTLESNEAPGELLSAVDWLNANFVVDAWAEIGR